jgi:hypothetical protein
MHTQTDGRTRPSNYVLHAKNRKAVYPEVFSKEIRTFKNVNTKPPRKYSDLRNIKEVGNLVYYATKNFFYTDRLILLGSRWGGHIDRKGKQKMLAEMWLKTSRKRIRKAAFFT